MKKLPIGFNTSSKEETKNEVFANFGCSETLPRKSVVQIYFPTKGMKLSYYNDSFDLKVGDMVYVEGKLEGHRGQVTDVSYSFKIKLSDYKKVIALVDTNVSGELYFAGSHVIAFDKNVIPSEKVKLWFKAPEKDEEYAISNDDTKIFPLEDLTEMNVSSTIAARGHEYYAENRVCYICIDGVHGYAIVKGSEAYEVEFNYSQGEISNLICSCFCSYTCKHQFASMLQLRETLEFITENYEHQHDDYFAAVDKETFMNIIMSKKNSGKISL